MNAIESSNHQKAKGAPGKIGPAVSRVFMAQGLRSSEDFTKEIIHSKRKPSEGAFNTDRGFIADAFFGASPVVASALGIRSGATPRERCQINMLPQADRPE